MQNGDTVTGLPSGGETKPVPPEKFDGNQRNLRSFLTSMKLYFKFRSGRELDDEDKILMAAMNMKGRALEWMQPHIDDFLKNDETIEECNEQTRRVMQSWEAFEKTLTGVFGQLDEEQAAIRSIERLKQVTRATDYTAEFVRLKAKLEWDDGPLIRSYYRGLKDNVKDIIARDPWPKTLQEMIELAIRVDNRLWERHVEKQNKNYVPKPTQKTHTSQKAEQDKGDPMEIDQVQKKTQKRQWTKEEKERFEKRACLGCGEMGHFRKECPKPKEKKVKKVGAVTIGMLRLKHRAKGDPERMSDPEDREMVVVIEADNDLTPITISQNRVQARLEDDECWICGDSSHAAYECPDRVHELRITGRHAMQWTHTVLQEQGRKSKEHRDLPPRSCERDVCLYHQFWEESIKQNPGLEEHKRLEELECDAKDNCYVHHAQQVELAHSSLGWHRCYDPDCTRHLRQKHIVEKDPRGPTIMYSDPCEDPGCKGPHPGQNHQKFSWQRCDKATDTCMFHLLQKEIVAYDHTHWAHGEIKETECLDIECETHVLTKGETIGYWTRRYHAILENHRWKTWKQTESKVEIPETPPEKEKPWDITQGPPIDLSMLDLGEITRIRPAKN